DAGVDLALLVEEAAALGEREHALMPDLGMDVEAAAAVEIEGDELLRAKVIARHGERHDEGRPIQREEELAAIGMIIGVPEQQLGPLAVQPRLRGPRGLLRPAEEIGVAHRVVAAIEHLALPPEGEHALGGAALIARIAIHLAPTL